MLCIETRWWAYVWTSPGVPPPGGWVPVYDVAAIAMYNIYLATDYFGSNRWLFFRVIPLCLAALALGKRIIPILLYVLWVRQFQAVPVFPTLDQEKTVGRWNFEVRWGWRICINRMEVHNGYQWILFIFGRFPHLAKTSPSNQIHFTTEVTGLGHLYTK